MRLQKMRFSLEKDDKANKWLLYNFYKILLAKELNGIFI